MRAALGRGLSRASSARSSTPLPTHPLPTAPRSARRLAPASARACAAAREPPGGPGARALLSRLPRGASQPRPVASVPELRLLQVPGEQIDALWEARGPLRAAWLLLGSLLPRPAAGGTARALTCPATKRTEAPPQRRPAAAEHRAAPPGRRATPHAPPPSAPNPSASQDRRAHPLLSRAIGNSRPRPRRRTPPRSPFGPSPGPAAARSPASSWTTRRRSARSASSTLPQARPAPPPARSLRYTPHARLPPAPAPPLPRPQLDPLRP